MKDWAFVLWAACAVGTLFFAVLCSVLALLGFYTDGHFAFVCMLICYLGTRLYFHELKTHHQRNRKP